MSSKNNLEPSTFMTAALALDGVFRRFEKLAKDLDQLPVDTDRGLERGLALLKELQECREQFTPASEDLAKGLGAAQASAAKAVEIIEKREKEVLDRQTVVTQLLNRYRILGDMVQRLTTSVNEIRSGGNELDDETKAIFSNRLPEFDEALTKLIDQARKLMDEARDANVKDLVRNADSLRQSLQSTRHRFGQLAGQNSSLPN